MQIGVRTASRRYIGKLRVVQIFKVDILEFFDVQKRKRMRHLHPELQIHVFLQMGYKLVKYDQHNICDYDQYEFYSDFSARRAFCKAVDEELIYISRSDRRESYAGENYKREEREYWFALK